MSKNSRNCMIFAFLWTKSNIRVLYVFKVTDWLKTKKANMEFAFLHFYISSLLFGWVVSADGLEPPTYAV